MRRLLLLCAVLVLNLQALEASSLPTLGDLNSAPAKNVDCGPNQRVTGIMIVYEYAEVIGDITVKCTNITHDGKWGTGGGYKDFSVNSSNYQWRKSAECPRDTFVMGITGHITSVPFIIPPGSMLTVQEAVLICGRSDSNGQVKSETGSIRLVAELPGKNLSGWYKPTKYCDNRGFAKGIRKSSTAGVAVGALNGSSVVKGIALRCATGTPNPPFNYDPPTPLTPSTGTNDRFRQVGSNQRFSIREVDNHSNHLVDYELCLRWDNRPICAMSKKVKRGETPFSLTIGEGLEGKAVEWRVRTCKRSGTNAGHCGHLSDPVKAYILPRPAELQRPMANARSPIRTVQFSWRSRPSASAGYQLVIWNASKKPRYEFDNPDAHRHVTGVSMNIHLPKGSAGSQLDVPTDLGKQLQWAVYACTDYNQRDRKRYCAKPLRRGRILNLSGGSSAGNTSRALIEQKGVSKKTNSGSIEK